MFCKKCGSDIASGAKFCTSCGTPVPVDDTVVCPSCGQTVPNKKFCRCCGTNLSEALAKPTVTPSEHAAAPVIAEKSEAFSAAAEEAPLPFEPVSVPAPTAVAVEEKPEAQSFDSANMMSQAAPSYVASAPTDNATTQTFDSANMMSQAAPSYGAAAPTDNATTQTFDSANMMSQAAPSYGAAAPSYGTAAPTDNATTVQNGFAAFTNDGAAMPDGMSGVSAVTTKKPHSMKLPIILGAVVVFLIAVFVVLRLFFWSGVTQFFLGEKGYIKMIEGNGISYITEVSSAAVNTLGTTASNAVMSADALKTSYSSDSFGSLSESIEDGGLLNALDSMSGGQINNDGTEEFAAVYPMLIQSLIDYAAGDGLSAEYSIDAEINDKLKPSIKEIPYSDMIVSIAEYLNSLKFKYSMCGDENGLQFALNAKDARSTLIDSVCVMRRDGKIYITMPSVSNKAIYAEIDIPESTEASEKVPSLVLDEKEVEKLIKSFVDVYLAQLDKAQTSIGDTEKLSVRGVEVSGKKVTVTLTENDFSEIAVGIVEKLRTNEYFKNTLLDFINEMHEYNKDGITLTFEDWDEMLSGLTVELTKATTDSGSTVVITSYVSASNDIVGKTYNFNNEFVLKYVKSGSKTIIADEDETVAAVVNEKSDTSGTIDLYIDMGGEDKLALTVEYTDAKMAEFAGKEMINGKYELYINAEDEALANALAENMSTVDSEMATLANDLLKGSRICFENKVTSSKVESTFKVYCPEYYVFGVNQTITVGAVEKFDVSGLDLIDVTKLSDEEQSQKLQDFVGEAADYYKTVLGTNDLLKSLGLTQEQLDELFAELEESARTIGLEKATQSEIEDIKALIKNCVNRLDDTHLLMIEKNINSESSLYDRYYELTEKFNTLHFTVDGANWYSIKENYDIAYAELHDFLAEVNTLYDEINNSADNVINVYSFSGAADYSVEKFLEENRDANYEIELYWVSSIDELNNVLGTDQAPDIILASSDEIAELNHTDYIATMSELGVSFNRNDYFKYTIDAATVNGKTYAIPCMICPGLVYYRKDYAEQYLGVRSREEMENAIASWPQFIQTANRIKNASQGSVLPISTRDELIDPFMCQVNGDNGEFSEEQLREFYETVQQLYNYSCFYSSDEQWTNEWTDGMNDGVMFYFGSTWYYGLNGMLPLTEDKWEVCAPPTPYYDGGVWVYGTKSAADKSGVAELIEYIAANKEHSLQLMKDKGAISPMKSVLKTYEAENSDDNRPIDFYYELAEDINVNGKNMVNDYYGFSQIFVTNMYDCIDRNASADEFIGIITSRYTEFIESKNNPWQITDETFDENTDDSSNEDGEIDFSDLPDDVYNADGTINYEELIAYYYGDEYVDLFKEVYGEDYDFAELFEEAFSYE